VGVAETDETGEALAKEGRFGSLVRLQTAEGLSIRRRRFRRSAYPLVYPPVFPTKVASSTGIAW
jgi:hypothetical protein